MKYIHKFVLEFSVESENPEYSREEVQKKLTEINLNKEGKITWEDSIETSENNSCTE